MSGVLVLSLSTVIVKVIGLAYKIPMIALLGAEGMGYFNSAYEIYDRGEQFDQYIQSRISLIHLSQKDTDFLREKLYEMYNNPVENYKKALASEC